MSLYNQAAKAVVSDDPGIQSRESADRGHRRRGWVNWGLALLTVPAAGLIMIYAIAAAMSIAACSDRRCPNLGPSGLLYGVLFYGAPVVAVLTIVASIFTATRRRGLIVPLCGWALLVADIVATALLFRT